MIVLRSIGFLQMGHFGLMKELKNASPIKPKTNRASPSSQSSASPLSEIFT